MFGAKGAKAMEVPHFEVLITKMQIQVLISWLGLNIYPGYFGYILYNGMKW